MDWGSDDEGDAQEVRDMEKKKTETTALLAEFQKDAAQARKMDNNQAATWSKPKANIGELTGNEDESKCCELDSSCSIL